ncbi:permease [Paenibacillus provencensis]|uniref:Permease n=2 Tax=Bacteria TaxID=2 RepID=A0ABW3PP47_9BACL|nr:permease [Paenibacillus sp. MER 78]MCM3127267.1 permease [Paenibacillus sp. MER 78]
MYRLSRASYVGISGFLLLGFSLMLVLFISMWQGALHIPSSLLQLNTIFLSILIEALPFVLIGVLIAGVIQIFVTEDHIRRWLPTSKPAIIVMSCVIGALFPACECGIVPIVRRLIQKGVPLYAGVGFMLTGPLINPIVIASTYMAFGNDLQMAALRMGIGFLIALLITFAVSMSFDGNQFRFTSAQSVSNAQYHSHGSQQKTSSIAVRIKHMLHHSIDEFFDMGKFLIIGAFIAAAVQTFVSAKTLLGMGTDMASSTLVMMGLAFVLSLCSEADAFIGSSFSHLFGTTPILAFLIFGPMLDLKNTIMMLSVFRTRFVVCLLALVILTIFTSLMLLNPYI